jgi:hypothetical protein
MDIPPSIEVQKCKKILSEIAEPLFENFKMEIWIIGDVKLVQVFCAWTSWMLDFEDKIPLQFIRNAIPNEIHLVPNVITINHLLNKPYKFEDRKHVDHVQLALHLFSDVCPEKYSLQRIDAGQLIQTTDKRIVNTKNRAAPIYANIPKYDPLDYEPILEKENNSRIIFFESLHFYLKDLVPLAVRRYIAKNAMGYNAYPEQQQNYNNDVGLPHK